MRPTPPKLTRRALIRGVASIGGLGAAYAALTAFDLMGHGALAQGTSTTEPLPNGSMAGKSVVVIGAGLAGLCSGMRVARAGAAVKILEATDRIGGRSLTLRHGDSYREWDWNSDTTMRFEQVGDVPPDDPDNYLNAGPGRIPQHHARVLDYCKELGVELQPYLYMDKANLMQNDAWNGGHPVQARRLKNDLRGHLAELMAKVSDQAALDQLVSPADADAFLRMLKHFGQLTGEGAQMVYAGAALKSDYIRAGYRVELGDVTQPGEPWPTLSLEDVLASDFWKSEMFDDLEYFWQTSLMEPTDGMDMIWKGFLPASVGPGTNDTVESLVIVNQPVGAIDMDGVNVVTTPLDPVPEVIDFVRDINDLRWARWQLIARHARFFRRYRRSLSAAQMSTLLLSGLRALMPGLDQNDLALVPRRSRAEVVTHYAPFQPLGRLYEPLIDLPNRLRAHFEPTMVTDGSGGLHPAMAGLAHGRSPEIGPPSMGKEALQTRQAAQA